jgi:hypothetical protein
VLYGCIKIWNISFIIGEDFMERRYCICWDIDPSILILDILVMINTIAFDDFGVSLSNSEKDQCKEQQSCSGDHGSKERNSEVPGMPGTSSL